MADKDLALSDEQSEHKHTATVLAQARQELQVCRDSEGALQCAMSRMEAEVSKAREAAVSAATDCKDLRTRLQNQCERAMDHEVRATAEQQAAMWAQRRVAALEEQLTEVQQKALASEERASDVYKRQARALLSCAICSACCSTCCSEVTFS